MRIIRVSFGDAAALFYEHIKLAPIFLQYQQSLHRRVQHQRRRPDSKVALRPNASASFFYFFGGFSRACKCESYVGTAQLLIPELLHDRFRGFRRLQGLFFLLMKNIRVELI